MFYRTFPFPSILPLLQCSIRQDYKHRKHSGISKHLPRIWTQHVVTTWIYKSTAIPDKVHTKAAQWPTCRRINHWITGRATARAGRWLLLVPEDVVLPVPSAISNSLFHSSQSEKSIVPGTVLSGMSKPLPEELRTALYAGILSHGCPRVHQLLAETVFRSRWIAIPLDKGRLAKFPKKNGMSAVCVPLNRETTFCGMTHIQAQDGPCWMSNIQAVILFYDARSRPSYAGHL